MLTIHHYIILSLILFTLGLMGLILRRNILVMLMCIEVLMNAINLLFIAVARFILNMDGHVVAMFVMAVAAAEAAVGLAIVVGMYRSRKTIKTSDWKLMKG